MFFPLNPKDLPNSGNPREHNTDRGTHPMPKPPTPIQQDAARKNGSKSRGPITQPGKAISSRNRYTHGLLSKTILIEGEEAARFAALLHSLRTDLAPANALEESLIEDLAICRWRQRRLLAMETASLSTEIRRQTAESAPEPDKPSNAIRAVQALAAISQNNRTLELINRHELRFSRQFNRTLDRLHTLQSARKSKNDDSNPAAA